MTNLFQRHILVSDCGKRGDGEALQFDSIHYTLYTASSEGNYETVLSLYAQGADVNAQGRHYGNALQAAAAHGHEKITQLLLAKGANVNEQGRYGTALQAAEQGGHKEVAQLLLAHGANQPE